MRQRAYTLIELLVVVIILGLVAGLGVPSLVRHLSSSPFDRTSLLLRTADHRLRELALNGDIAVETMSDGLRYRLGSDERVVTCEPEVDVTWLTPTGRPLRGFTVDRHGRSQDLLVAITVDEEHRRYAVSGISGEWSLVVSEPATNEQP